MAGDTSATVEAILTSVNPTIALRTLLETSIVLYRAGGTAAVRYLDHFIVETRIAPISFTTDHLEAAREAFTRYGKGSGHAAKLNFGDLFRIRTRKNLEGATAVQGR